MAGAEPPQVRRPGEPGVTIIIAAGIPSALLLAFLVFFVTNPDKLYFWLGKALGLLGWARKSIRERAAAAQIEGQVNSFRESVQSQAEGVLPYGLRLQWHSQVDPETFVQADNVIVRMACQTNPERNLVTSALAYCSRAVVPRARPYLERSLLRSVDLVVTKKMLAHANAHSSLEYFWDSVYEPECRGDSAIQRYCVVMDGLDEKGFFTRILLREFLEFGVRIYPRALRDSERFAQESKAFVKYLDVLALRGPGEEVELSFVRDHIRMGVVLIARPKTLALAGLDPYIKWLRTYKVRDAHAVYICARSYNIPVARNVAQAGQDQALGTIVSESTYRAPGPAGGRALAVCITFRPSRG